MSLSLCLYPDGSTVVSEACSVDLVDNHATYNFGPVPADMDHTSFRCIFDNPATTRAREYKVAASEDSRWVAMNIEASKRSSEECSIIYRTPGISLSIWYDCIIKGESAMLTGWATISNRTGISFDDAALSFIISDAREPRVYSLYETISIPLESEIHIELCTSSMMEIHKRLIAPSDSESVYQEEFIKNSETGDIGFDLPPGPIRVFEHDGKQPFQIDTGVLPANVAGDEIAIRSSKAPNIFITGTWDYSSGEAVVDVHNHRSEEVLVEVEESELAEDIVEASHPLNDQGGFRFFPVQVQPNTISRLKYKVSEPALLRGRPQGYGMQTSLAFRPVSIQSALPV